MLVISRRAGESITIAGGIEIEVLETGNSRVKLGIKAPRAIPVLRTEVETAAEQNRHAATGVSLERIAPLLESLRHHT